MPGIDFFEYVRDEDIIDGIPSFGICDDPGELPAFISYDRSVDTWIAEVLNPGLQRIQFLPVDKHITLRRHDGTEAMRCDAMLLTSPLHTKGIVVFIELKDVLQSKWSEERKHAVEQLGKTIEFFSEYHLLESYEKRLAYVANRRGRPHANRAYTSDIQRFWNEYRVRLRFKANIDFS